jgi:hypothetical protein
MKVEKFKNLIKESIKEVLVEEGLLKEVISAVIEETKKTDLALPSAAVSPQINLNKESPFKKTVAKNLGKLNELRSKMSESIGKSSYSGLYNLEGVDLFEGTTPLANGGSPGASQSGQGPLSGVEPDDAGVAIDSLLGNKELWEHLIKK